MPELSYGLPTVEIFYNQIISWWTIHETSNVVLPLVLTLYILVWTKIYKKSFLYPHAINLNILFIFWMQFSPFKM